jgi:ribosome biogenesis GTPase
MRMEDCTVPTREQSHWKHVEEEKLLRRVRKEIKRNRKPDCVRRRDWRSEGCDDPDALDELSFPQSERVMPRGERERRRALWAAATIEFDEEDAEAVSVDGPSTGSGQALRPQEPASGEATHFAECPRQSLPRACRGGRVVEVSSGLCRVVLDDRSVLCSLRGSLSTHDTGFTNVVAVGDEVMVSIDGGEPGGAGARHCPYWEGPRQGVVEAVLPRRSALARPDVFHGHLQQVIVANADQLLIVASWREPAIWLELVDRYLITAERNRLSPIICVNKIDLAEDTAAPRAIFRPYLALGYPVIFTSAVTGQGVDELCKVLRLQTTVLAGLSGVGKSSLLAAVQPGLHLRTAEVSDRRHEGRHTTAQVTMLELEMGGYVVDTPGIREFGLSGLRRRDLASFYREIAAVAGRCRFADCTHLAEPGCAVKASMHQGRIAAARYHNYRKIYESLPE